MSEVQFAKQFLTQLETKPIKLPSDYVADARRLPAQPAYTLPRQATPYSPPAPTIASTSTSQTTPATAPTSSASTVTITFQPLRRTPNLPATLSLPISSPAQTSIYDLKTQLSPQTGFAPDKLRLLWDKKPVPDSKTVAEVLEGGTPAEGAASMGVMFIGSPTFEPSAVPVAAVAAAAAAAAAVGTAAPEDGDGDTPVPDAPPLEPQADEGDEVPGAAQVAPGRAVLHTKEFWEDLKGFVVQRVRDEDVAAELVRLFREAWHTVEEGKGPT